MKKRRVMEVELEGGLKWIGSESGRKGDGELIFYDGSRLIGRWTNDGLLEGEARFVHADGKSELRGTWRHDTMICALFYSNGRKQGVQEYAAEVEWPPVQPLLEDPFESLYVSVAPSTLANGAGEGLFAKREVPADFLICFYNGCFVEQDVVDKRSWRYNANAITRDQDYCIDVPAPFGDMRNYCASLGHKANHSKALQNAKYCAAFSPRFGDICGIRTIRSIAKGEEIFVDYDYNHARLPSWYQE